MKKFPVSIQHDAMDCGIACIKMITDYYGCSYTIPQLKEVCIPSREGVALSSISETLEELGFKSLGGRLTLDRLVDKVVLPCIIHWNQEHFVVLYKIKKTKKGLLFYIADPAMGLVKYNTEDFKNGWVSTSTNNEEKGIILVVEKSVEQVSMKKEAIYRKASIATIFPYFTKFKKYFVQLFLGLVFVSFIQLLFPYLTQSIVDVGIKDQNIEFIYLVLLAQVVLLISRTSVEFIQNWILLHISTRVNISMLSDFMIKLMRLPMSFFDTKLVGDILQRIQDHSRVEKFITVQSLNVVYSVGSMLIFGIVLYLFSIKIFIVFFLGSLLYAGWLLLFINKRKILDYKNFEQLAIYDNKTYQLITGMQEIKLQNNTQRKRWEWEDTQANLFETKVSLLKQKQIQDVGKFFINETKNVLITFLAATAVIEGSMTLGVMLAVQYIIGQLVTPVESIATFIYNIQDAKISLERIDELKRKDDENVGRDICAKNIKNSDIVVENVNFCYNGTSQVVLKDINLIIPSGKTTAIVGASGSGKTTLIKLLLQYYPVKEGSIKVDGNDINKMDTNVWRANCGAVMQEGYIFSDSIAKNIAVSQDEIDCNRLLYAAKVANIHEFVEELPSKYDTVVGQDGRSLSQGQKQRILIARAVYKNPNYIFLDEATNALDATNERCIVDNLSEFYKEKTVLVVAHRLSTVQNADQIVVLDKGQIVEIGSHKELITIKGYYYNLIKNQLELGN
ncbi:ATP-binding cassette subfamily B protein [Dysgonomonas alginatilytica]|uniref:ATP-binding cassette subfamily B protein n=1 Tax=Dysgonomonas alginatilytica TaxID=1605892 RepID=A0A2V3PII4_9BACT|nr:peptidase domain-containing ABC transporter [Dysgonomonas alginatilytica]PXV59348.1 ATP-binding cassette subfamily B protein [Dysgonomonas alginatilytica]